jgi:hypothetical protein
MYTVKPSPSPFDMSHIFRFWDGNQEHHRIDFEQLQAFKVVEYDDGQYEFIWWNVHNNARSAARFKSKAHYERVKISMNEAFEGYKVQKEQQRKRSAQVYNGGGLFGALPSAYGSSGGGGGLFGGGVGGGGGLFGASGGNGMSLFGSSNAPAQGTLFAGPPATAATRVEENLGLFDSRVEVETKPNTDAKAAPTDEML